MFIIFFKDTTLIFYCDQTGFLGIDVTCYLDIYSNESSVGVSIGWDAALTSVNALNYVSTTYSKTYNLKINLILRVEHFFFKN